VQLTQAVGQLPVHAHRVRQARDAEDAGVRRGDQDRDREHSHVGLDGAREGPEVDGLDRADDRVLGVASLFARNAEQRPAALLPAFDGQR
jgi:hypothetical protein